MRMSWWAELCCKSLCSVWGRSHMYWVHGSLPCRLFVDIGTAVFTFDLFYICSGHQNWLNLDKRVLEHDFARRAGSLVLIFAVRWEIVLIVYFFYLVWKMQTANFIDLWMFQIFSYLSTCKFCWSSYFCMRRYLLMIYLWLIRLIFRFYVESIASLRDIQTVEVFFLNAKQAIFKVSTLIHYFLSLYQLFIWVLLGQSVAAVSFKQRNKSSGGIFSFYSLDLKPNCIYA